jgi:hypothetical protein
VGGQPADKQRRGEFHYDNDVPNFPEVSGTSFPVLTTVLAGFAVTIIVQIILQPDGTDELPWRVTLGLAAFLLSTLALLLSTIFAINAQARNYLPFFDLNDVGARLLNVDDIPDWLQEIEQAWYVYHWAALIAFYSGVALLLGGINLIVWVYAGPGLAIMFLTTILLILGITIAIAMYVARIPNTRRRGKHME